MPPEKHISVVKQDLLAALKNRLAPADQGRFDDLVKLMEGVASFDFMDLKSRMRTNFLPFASGARNSTYIQRASKGMPTTTALDKKVRAGRRLVWWRGAARGGGAAAVAAVAHSLLNQPYVAPPTANQRRPSPPRNNPGAGVCGRRL